MKKLVLLSCVVFGLSAFSTPTMSDLKVTPIEPLGLAIDCTISGAEGLDRIDLFDVKLTANDATYTAKTLLYATNYVNGAHRIYWNMAQDGISLDATNCAVEVSCSASAPYCVIDFSNNSSSPADHVRYLSLPPHDGFNTEEYKTTKIVLKRVEAGSFIMDEDQTNEAHRVTLTRVFYMGLFEVTQKQWEMVTGSSSSPSVSAGVGDVYPVHYVPCADIRGRTEGVKYPWTNSVDSTSFLGKLRDWTEVDFDLPTEAQWEYTCRAGTTTKYSYGDNVDDDYMWYTSNSSSKTHEVGTKNPNPWGFYDMHGNVWEWCLERYGSLSWREYGTDPKGSTSGNGWIIRGGGWSCAAWECTSFYRYGLGGGSTEFGTSYGWIYNTCDIGFRLAGPSASFVASVKDVKSIVIGDKNIVDGAMRLGYAPSEKQNAVVKIGDEVLLNAGEAGSFAWYAPTAGTYKVSHTVGDDVLSATYVVTNGYAKIEDEANPPMDLVEGITISPMEISAAAKGGRSLITISGNGEAWTGATSADWLTLNSTEGTAEGKKVICTIGENGAAESRVGYVYLAGQTVTVTQAGRGATVDTQVVADTAGGEVSVAVSVTDETTTWGAWSDCSWILVLTRSGTGSGEVKLQVAPWNSTRLRTGTVTIGGQIVTVTQEAAKIVYPTVTAVTVGADRTSDSFEIVVANGVSWEATSDASWLVVEDDSQSRRGDGTVTWTAQGQTTTLPRTATITVTPAKEIGFESWSFRVTQEGAVVELSKVSAAVCAQGEDVLIDVSVASGVDWSIENVPEWMTLEGEVQRKGAGTVKLTVTPNTTYEERSAVMTIAGQEFAVTQAAAKIEFEGSLIRYLSADGGDLEITVRVDVATAPWSIDISENAKDDWVFLLEGDEARVGSDIFTLSVWESSDEGELPREATVTLGTQVLTIRQVAEIPDPVPTVAADAEEEQLVLALEGSADKRLAENIKDVTKYAKYHAWVDKIAGTGVDHFGTRQTVKDSELTWFAYALDLSALPEKAPESLTIDTILSAAEGGWDLEVKVEDLKVGSGASAADFGTVFTVEGAADLKEESFSADNVTTTFGAAENGKVKVEVEPKEAKGQFFIRVKMTP